MDWITARALIEKARRLQTELDNVEFKESSGSLPNDVWQEITEFANVRGGGLIVFGISRDEKTVKGLHRTNIRDYQLKISQIINQRISYPLRPTYFVKTLEKKDILAVYIPECPKEYRPCYNTDIGLPNGAYIRDGLSKRMITDEEMRRMLAESKAFKFDSTRAFGARTADLDEEKIKQFLEESADRASRSRPVKYTESNLINLGILGKFGKTIAPTVAGHLIFNKKQPQRLKEYERYVVRCIRYAGFTTTSDILDKEDISETLDVQIDRAYQFILRNISKRAVISGTKRKEQYEYPEEAIREAVANAVIHRDYRITETYTQIAIFDDRIEISNPGSLPPGVTEENIKDAQVSRNETIAGRLKDLNYLEEYGRGFDIIFERMEQWGLLRPLIKNSVNQFQVILLGSKIGTLNERQLKIWKYLLEYTRINPRQIRELLLPDVPRPTVNLDLKKMKDAGLIEAKGHSNNLYYSIRL